VQDKSRPSEATCDEDIKEVGFSQLAVALVMIQWWICLYDVTKELEMSGAVMRYVLIAHRSMSPDLTREAGPPGTQNIWWKRHWSNSSRFLTNGCIEDCVSAPWRI